MEDDNKHSWLNDILLLIIALSLITIGCISCKTVQYEPVSSIKSEQEYNNATRVDSIVEIDSIYIHERAKGDTIYRDKVVYRYRDRVKLVHDTIYRSRVDSVRVPYPVERELNLWEQTKVSIGGAAILICTILAFIHLIKSKRK